MTESPAAKKILIVDDDREVLAAISTAMAGLSPNVITASNGADGVAKAQEIQPDLMILDQMMPGLNGLLVLEKVKKGKKKADSPRVIMITANRGGRHKDYAVTMGVDAYMNKPFRVETLVDTAKKLLGMTPTGPHGVA